MVIKATNAAPQFWEEFQSRFGRLANLSFSTIQIGIINSIFVKLVSSIGSIALGLGSILVINKELHRSSVSLNSLQVNVVGLIGLVI